MTKLIVALCNFSKAPKKRLKNKHYTNSILSPNARHVDKTVMNSLDILCHKHRATTMYTIILLHCLPLNIILSLQKRFDALMRHRQEYTCISVVLLFYNDRSRVCSIRVVVPCYYRREPTRQPGARPYTSNKTQFSRYYTL